MCSLYKVLIEKQKWKIQEKKTMPTPALVSKHVHKHRPTYRCDVCKVRTRWNGKFKKDSTLEKLFTEIMIIFCIANE